MDYSEGDDATELSRSLNLIDELQSGMAALWSRLKATKTSPSNDEAPAGIDDNASE